MVVIFFSSVSSVLYYLGVMQVIIIKLAWLMQVTLKVSGVEALCAAANVFVGLVSLGMKYFVGFFGCCYF
jgi:pyrimidine nucleoside transport protein